MTITINNGVITITGAQPGEVIQRDTDGEFVSYEFLTKEDGEIVERQRVKVFAESNKIAIGWIDNDGNKQAMIDSAGRGGFNEVTAKELKVVSTSNKASIISSNATAPRQFVLPDANIDFSEMFTGTVTAGQDMEVVNGLIKSVL